MTLQIGMIGADGIVIAGDTLWISSPITPELSQISARIGDGHSKIKINKQRTIAIALSGDMEEANSVADRVIAELEDVIDEEDRKFRIERIGDEVFAGLGPEIKSACLIGFKNPEPGLYSFNNDFVRSRRRSLCRKTITTTYAGDTVNAALFWSMRYYRKGLRVRQLIPFAAHLVVSAGLISSGHVGGLEVVYIDSSGVHRVSEQSNTQLENKSLEWARNIEQMIMTPLHLTLEAE